MSSTRFKLRDLILNLVFFFPHEVKGMGSKLKKCHNTGHIPYFSNSGSSGIWDILSQPNRLILLWPVNSTQTLPINSRFVMLTFLTRSRIKLSSWFINKLMLGWVYTYDPAHCHSRGSWDIINCNFIITNIEWEAVFLLRREIDKQCTLKAV